MREIHKQVGCKSGDTASQAIKDEKKRRQRKREARDSYGTLTAILSDMKASQIPWLGCRELCLWEGASDGLQ